MRGVLPNRHQANVKIVGSAMPFEDHHNMDIIDGHLNLGRIEKTRFTTFLPCS